MLEIQAEGQLQAVEFPIETFKYTCTRDSSAFISSASTVGSDSVDLGKDQIYLPLDAQGL